MCLQAGVYNQHSAASVLYESLFFSYFILWKNYLLCETIHGFKSVQQAEHLRCSCSDSQTHKLNLTKATGNNSSLYPISLIFHGLIMLFTPCVALTFPNLGQAGQPRERKQTYMWSGWYFVRANMYTLIHRPSINPKGHFELENIAGKPDKNVAV